MSFFISVIMLNIQYSMPDAQWNDHFFIDSIRLALNIEHGT
jgi:hypothetical protein